MNENDLKKFVAFTKDLLNSIKDKQEYAWFVELYKEEIIKSFFNSQSTSSIPIKSKFDAITEHDIIRVKSYLNLIDRKAIPSGKEFYKDVNDIELRKNLVKDFKEMKIALVNNDIIEFGRRLYLQIENIFNSSLINLDIHNLIHSNMSLYSKVSFQWHAKNKPYDFNFYKSFFIFDNVENKIVPVELSKVSFNTKSVFLLNHFNFTVNKFNLDDIYFLRNKGSHRDSLSEKESDKLREIFDRFDTNYSFYFKVLYDIKNKITNI